LTIEGSIITFQASGTYFLSYFATASTSVTQSSGPEVDGTIATFVTAYDSSGYSYAGSGTTRYILNCVIQTSAGGTLTLSNSVVLGLTAELVVTNCTSSFS